MNAEKRVFNALFKEDKTELATQKVELALVDDLKGFIKKGLKIESDLASDLRSYNGLLRSGNGFQDKYKKLIASAKDLGVPVPSELTKLEEIAKGFIKKGEAVKKVSNLF